MTPVEEQPKPRDIFEDDVGCAWTVIGVHDRPSVILENKVGERIIPAIDSPMFKAMRRSATPTPEPELLPCPFCGGEAMLKQYHGSYSKPVDWVVYCAECDLAPGGSRDRLEAIAKWNTRHSVAKPLPANEQVEPTATELWELWCEMGLGSFPGFAAIMPKFFARAVARFVTQPPAPVERVLPSDEEIIDAWRDEFGGMLRGRYPGIINIFRALLKKAGEG